MSASRSAVAILGGALVLLFAREASASGASTAQWYVETRGASCQAERSAFEHEIQLACDAVGGSCGVAATPTDATLRAVLECSDANDGWTLVTRTAGGTVLATLDLSGSHDDRLREAAVEVARDATPVRSLAIETLRFSISGEQPQPIPSGPPQTLGLVIGGAVSSWTDSGLPAMIGARLLAGLEIAHSMRATLGFGAEAGGSGLAAARAVRGGVGLALGAPFDPDAPLGFAVEGGLSAISAYSLALPSDATTLPAVTARGAYGQATVLVQWPARVVRPYAGLSGGVVSEPALLGVSGQMGIAVSLF